MYQRTPLQQPAFLPMNRSEMLALGWQEIDVLLVSGDAYVDHPSFGVPLLGRWLVAHGFRVGLVCQPPWGDAVAAQEAMQGMGRPRLFAGVSAGALDSMLAHYTAFRKKRSDDAYTAGGQAGARPNRAVTVYANLLRRAFPGLPLVGGGIEASLRRLTHYDFWTDALRRSILLDARLDLLIYGMGEKALLEAAQRLDTAIEEGAALLQAEDLARVWRGIRGTARSVSRAEYQERTDEQPWILPSHEAQCTDPKCFLQGTLEHEQLMHQGQRPLAEPCEKRWIWLEPSASLMSQDEMDALYALPFSRLPHPSYTSSIPAVEMMATSITSHRGCGGGCSFCSLALHQGRCIASRSRASVLDEAKRISHSGRFKGAISDVGGPSANMWGAFCGLGSQKCGRASCLHPALCKHFKVDQKACIELLRAVQRVPGVKHVRVASGVRFDLALADAQALQAYSGEFTGGQLKIAPEHCEKNVLDAMRKPGIEAFERFLQSFVAQSAAKNKEQYVVPYLMSAFPGCTMEHMQKLAQWLKARNWAPQQVQCFIPTPGTVATAMYYTGLDTHGQALHVARSDAERLAQHGLLAPEAGSRFSHAQPKSFGSKTARHKKARRR